MSSLIEEARFFPYMPESFMQCCPHCGGDWLVETFNCEQSRGKQRAKCPPCWSRGFVSGGWWASTSVYRSPRDMAERQWPMLWRNYVQLDGLGYALERTNRADKRLQLFEVRNSSRKIAHFAAVDDREATLLAAYDGHLRSSNSKGIRVRHLNPIEGVVPGIIQVETEEEVA